MAKEAKDADGERAAMRWVKRGLWLAAWSFWLWLGFGLYRELPRELGPVVCTIPFYDGSSYHGFLENESTLVTTDIQEDDKPDVVRLWNARTGDLARSIELPTKGSDGNAAFSPTNAFVVTERKRNSKPENSSTLLSALDLRTAKWVDLPIDAKPDPEFHEVRPWAAFWDFGEKEESGTACVVDLCTGAELFRWPGRRGNEKRELDAEPFFIGDRFAVPSRPLLRDNESYDSSKRELEIWSIPPGAAPKRVVKGLSLGDDPTASPGGRIAWYTIGAIPSPVDVYDIELGRMIFSDPPRETRGQPLAGSGGWSGPSLSRDGRLVYSSMRGVLWEVDSGREIWPKLEGAKLNGWDERGRIEVVEEWALPYLKDSVRVTYAVRDAYSKKLRYRCWNSSLRSCSKDESLTVQGEASLDETLPLTIHEMPLRVNYPLLALCQAILALPLVMLWAILRWRRKRKMRMASTAP